MFPGPCANRELAALAGITTRTVRHYHRIELLPEPSRRDNGYRSYAARDVVRLVRIRRLVELGVSLDEVGDALAGDDDRELREILAEIDADLAAQEQRIRDRRERIAEMLASDGDLTVSAEVAQAWRGTGKCWRSSSVDAVALAVRNLGLRELVPPEAVGDPAAADLLEAAVTAGLPPAQARCLALMFGHWREESR